MSDTEVWRDIDGYPGYEVSSLGRVRSAKRGRPRILRLWMGGEYPCAELWKGGVPRRIKVHRLVGEAFLGPRQPGMVTRHLDGDSSNNALENLRYGTSSENQLDTIRHGRHANANATHCPQGHEYTPENTVRESSTGSRRCRICRREQNRRQLSRRTAQEGRAS